MWRLWTHEVEPYCTLLFLWDIWNLLESCSDIKQMLQKKIARDGQASMLLKSFKAFHFSFSFWLKVSLNHHCPQSHVYLKTHSLSGLDWGKEIGAAGAAGWSTARWPQHVLGPKAWVEGTPHLENNSQYKPFSPCTRVEARFPRGMWWELQWIHQDKQNEKGITAF